MAFTRSGRHVFTTTLVVLVANCVLSTALSLRQRSGTAAAASGRDDFVRRVQLLQSTNDKRVHDEDDDSARRLLKDVVDRLATSRRHFIDKARESIQLKSRDSKSRRAAFDDEDPLLDYLGRQSPDTTRGHNDGRTLTDSAKRNSLLSTADKNFDYKRDIERKSAVAGPARDQRLLQNLHRPSRQDFMYAIGAAAAPSSSGSSSDLFGSNQFGSHGWDRTADKTEEASYEYYWVECEENDPDCEGKRIVKKMS